MFRNRNSQKPNEELLASFKLSYPQLHGTTLPTTVPSSHPHSAGSLTDALDSALNPRQFSEHEDIKDAEHTPRGSAEHWRFTPSLMDPNSFAFANFANQPPGYYTPTPGGHNTLYHSQAGDLHTPGFHMGIGTPLSNPTSEAPLHAPPAVPSMNEMHGIQSHHFHHPHQFSIHQTIAPHQFSNAHGSFNHLSGPTEESAMDNLGMDMELHDASPVMTFDPQHLEQNIAPRPVHQAAEDFRYNSTLNAPTAMVKQREEIPVTYLNKGQTYVIKIIDTMPEQSLGTPIKYRTFVRISFEDESQRQRPGACWQLWKEGRGTSEAHQRGGRLQAVEHVDQAQLGGPEDPTRPTVEETYSSFDGFCVEWTLAPNGSAACNIGVRFNFLSTDFSHSKGVKGIPVRLCAKTEMIDGPAVVSLGRPTAEVCFCKVKLFRDHGAERKLSNDAAHVRKTIDKLNDQIAKAESGAKEFGKRKRSGSISRATASSRPGKVQKHKRTFSMSSVGSPGKTSAEDDLHSKLATLKDMFSSTLPASVLFLRGTEQDDPDLHPVKLSGESSDLTKLEPMDLGSWEKQSVKTADSSLVSPTPSSHSLHSGSRRESSFQHPAPFAPLSSHNSNEWSNMVQDLQSSNPQHLASPPDQPIKVQPHSDGIVPGWIDAIGVDSSYQPPPERAIKPVACIYIQPRISGLPVRDNYYRAIYLMDRTLDDFVGSVAAKSDIDASRVTRSIRVNHQGLPILLDDECIRELPEGQAMTAEFAELKPQAHVKREWDAGPTDLQVDGDLGLPEASNLSGYELKLHY
ncbi:MAG: hypothetical protein M1820_009117 [Bogoriella megaspora]|nr:MAG: hypothetical protein M1820_009117 [Bogoriella megaspora]